jgi:hypothetical protein
METQLNLFVDGLISVLRFQALAPNAALVEALRWHGIAPGTSDPLDLEFRIAIQRQYEGPG